MRYLCSTVSCLAPRVHASSRESGGTLFRCRVCGVQMFVDTLSDSSLFVFTRRVTLLTPAIHPKHIYGQNLRRYIFKKDKLCGNWTEFLLTSGNWADKELKKKKKIKRKLRRMLPMLPFKSVIINELDQLNAADLFSPYHTLLISMAIFLQGRMRQKTQTVTHTSACSYQRRKFAHRHCLILCK